MKPPYRLRMFYCVLYRNKYKHLNEIYIYINNKYIEVN